MAELDDYVSALNQDPEAAFGNITAPVVKALAGSAVKNAMVPGQMMTPNPYPPGSEEHNFFEDSRVQGGLDWAHKNSMSMLGGGTAFTPKGAAGTFGTKLATGWDKDAEARAIEMINRYKHPEDIWNKEGIMIDPVDHVMRNEIPDNALAVKALGTEGPMSETIIHNKLYKEYPQLKDMKAITRLNDQGGGLYTSRAIADKFGGNRLEIDAPNLVSARKTAAHEINHAVSDYNDLNQGANYHQVKGWMDEYLKNNKQLPSAMQFMDPDRVAMVSTLKDPGFGMYLRNADEVRADNAINRLDFTNTARGDIPPWKTQRVPYSSQWKWTPKNYMESVKMPESIPGGRAGNALKAYLQALFNHGTGNTR